MSQGPLSFQYQSDKNSNCTSLAGLPLFMDMAKVSGLCDAIAQALNIKQRGWMDQQIILSLILLNLSGGDCVDDIERLEEDDGLKMLFLKLETHGMTRKARREYERRFRKSKERAFPSATVIHSYLKNFHHHEENNKRVDGKAFIPEQNQELKALCKINRVLIGFMQEHSPCDVATLDQDATLCETNKSSALYCYKKFKSYQPFNTYWHEQSMLLHSEFRDGNVPASFEQLRLLEESLDLLPASVKKVYLRSDSAGYQENLLAYCAEGKNERFGVIEFAIAARVSKSFKVAVAELEETVWNSVDKTLPDGSKLKTDQEWAEVCFVPSWTVQKKGAPTYRYLAIREKLMVQQTLEGIETTQQAFPFQTMEMKHDSYKLFAIVTNRSIHGNELIHWHRERCGDSEKIHSVEKTDLAGNQFPSNKFGANAAWWQIMVLSLNLTALMKSLALPNKLSKKRMKGLRFHLIGLAGRVIFHARGIIIKVGGGDKAIQLVKSIKERIAELAMPPPESQGG